MPHPTSHPADPTGTLIISMLSKKLERMAAEERRQQRQRRRAERKAAAAAAAAGVGAPPPAGPEAAAGVAAQMGPSPERKEGPSVVQLGERAERPLGFGAALKRLLSNPEVRQGCAGWEGRRVRGCIAG